MTREHVVALDDEQLTEIDANAEREGQDRASMIGRMIRDGIKCWRTVFYLKSQAEKMRAKKNCGEKKRSEKRIALRRNARRRRPRGPRRRRNEAGGPCSTPASTS